MANTITEILEKVLVASTPVWRRHSMMPRLVNRNYEGDARRPGDVVNIPRPTQHVAQDVVPSATSPAPDDQAPESVQLRLDQWKRGARFHLTDKERTEIVEGRHFVPDNIEASMETLARQMNEHILGQYAGVYGAVGTPGTKPFLDQLPNVAAETMAAMNNQLAPTQDLRFLLNPNSAAYATITPALSDLDKTGDSQARTNSTSIQGYMGRKMGFDWYQDQSMPDHTAGTAQGTAILVNGAVAPGTDIKTVNIDGGTGDLVVGDIFTFASHSQTYTVTAAVPNAAAGALQFEPALQEGVADNSAVTVMASHQVNLAFHRDAFTFASARFLTPLTQAKPVAQVQDPITGVVLRLTIEGQYHQEVWQLDALYGSLLVNPNLAVRVMG